MTWIEDRYLLVSHKGAGFQAVNNWTLYHVGSSEPSAVIKAYSLDRSAYNALNGVKYDSWGKAIRLSSIDGRISSFQHRLYVYKPPSEETAERSNGRVEICALSPGSN